ncbi:MAG: metallophosphoesterase family protein [Bacteroidales bacterium]|jgi:hypothetical protein|nr:metallophosphoesterase family protein [Bacteroidales bacterium]
MAYIGLISDSHGYFDDKLRKFLEPVDVVWHAGDFGTGEVAQEIAAFKPLVGVYGNCDGYDVRTFHSSVETFEQDGMGVLMTHIGGYPGHYDLRAKRMIEMVRPQIFVCGHSHILKVVYDEYYDMMVLNPGASGLEGFHLVRTALRFRIEDGKLKDMEVGEWPKYSKS